MFGDIVSVSAAPCAASADAAQDLRKESKLREARTQLLACSNRSCNSVIRADCEKWLKEVDEQMPSLVIRSVDSRGSDVIKGVRVTIDDSPVELDGTPVQLDPGQHVIKAKTQSGETTEQTTLVVLGEQRRRLVIRFRTELDQDGNRLDTTVPPFPPTTTPSTPPSTPPRVIPIALAGIGVVSLIVFGYLQIAGHAAYDELEQTCGKTPAKCPPSKTDPVRQQFVGSAVALGISAFALSAAVVIYVVTRPSSSATSPTPRASTIQLRDGAIVF
jgi:hypothetical protein